MVPAEYIQCAQKEKFLDRLLDEAAREQFVSHLQGCDSCRHQVEEWGVISGHFAEWTGQQTGIVPNTPTAPEAKLFVRQLNEKLAISAMPPVGDKSGFPFRRFLPLAAAAVIAVAAVIYGRAAVYPADTPPKTSDVTVADRSAPPRVQWTVWHIRENAGIEEKREPADNAILRSGAGERIVARVADDTIGMDNHSRLAVQRIDPQTAAFRLQQGMAVFEVSPRSHGNRFQVLANDISITVIGTRFAVEIKNQDVMIGVGKGTVLVQRQSERFRLSAGNTVTVSPGVRLADSSSKLSEDGLQVMAQLLSQRALPPATPSASPVPLQQSGDRIRAESGGAPKVGKNLAQWRELIVSGRNSEAARQIQSYLSVAPHDSDALMLLAAAQKNDGKFLEAFQTYQKVIGASNPALANQARYLAGELAQTRLGQKEQAVKLFENYLLNSATGSPIRGEAKFRLARTLLDMNQNDRAKKLLQEIVDEYRRSSVGNRARNLLEEIP